VFFLKTLAIRESTTRFSLFTFHAYLAQNHGPCHHHNLSFDLDPYLDLHLDLCLHPIQAGKVQGWGQIGELLLQELWLP
jgi:hypothetical protein